MDQLQRIEEKLDQLVREIRDLRQYVQQPLPPEIGLAEAMRLTNHKSSDTFYRWCKAKRVRRLSRGRYSLRRIQDALSA